MHWFERKIRRYEHRRWTTDDNRRVQPFHWGLEHIGGSPNDPNPRTYVREYACKAIESSREWYAASPAADYPPRPRKRPNLHQLHRLSLARKRHRPRPTFSRTRDCFNSLAW